MAIVVESVSNGTEVSGSSITITKPTGLEVGDLLIAILGSAEADGAGVGTWNILSGWSDAETNAFGGAASMSVQYIVATSTEVAASNFTFTSTASNGFNDGTLLRCTGFAPMDFVGTTATHTAVGANSTTISASLTSYTPGADGALVILQFGIDDGAGPGAKTFSGYTTTTSGISFTEAYDTGGTGGATAAAYGIQSTNAALTAYGAGVATASDDHYGQIVVFIPPVDATGTNTLVTTTSTAFTATGTADGIAENNLATATGVTFAQGGNGTNAPTAWSNQSKNSSTWTNQDKS